MSSFPHFPTKRAEKVSQYQWCRFGDAPLVTEGFGTSTDSLSAAALASGEVSADGFTSADPLASATPTSPALATGDDD